MLIPDESKSLKLLVKKHSFEKATWVKPGWVRQRLLQLLSTRCCLAVEAALEPDWRRHKYFFVKRMFQEIWFTCALTPKVTAFMPATPKRGDVIPLYSPRNPSFLWTNRWKNHAWTRYPTSRSRTSSRRFPCRCPLETSGFAPSLCPKDNQPTPQLLLCQDLFCIFICCIKRAYLPYNLRQTQEPLSLLVFPLFFYRFVCSLLQGLAWFLFVLELDCLGLRSFRPLVFPIWHHVTTGLKNSHWR